MNDIARAGLLRLEDRRPERGTRKKRKKRRSFRVLHLLIGWLCLPIALVFLFIGFWGEHRYDAAWAPQRMLAGVFGVAGLLLLLARRLMDGYEARTAVAAAPAARHAHEHRRRRHGAALLLALALTGALAALALHLLLWSGAVRNAAAADVRGARLDLALLEAVHSAARALADDDDLGVDHPDEKWARPVRRVLPEGIEVEWRIQDGGRRFDLNALAAPSGTETARPAADMVADLLRRAGQARPADAAEALRDAVDEDTDGRFEQRSDRSPVENRPLIGAWDIPRAAGFAGQSPPFPAPDGAEGKPALGDLTTLHPPAGRARPTVNVNTASRAVLLALLGDDQSAAVDALIAQRELHPLRALDPITVFVEPLRMARVRPWLDVRSAFFEIRATARDTAGGAVRRVVALAGREPDGRVRVLRWSSGA